MLQCVSPSAAQMRRGLQTHAKTSNVHPLSVWRPSATRLLMTWAFAALSAGVKSRFLRTAHGQRVWVEDSQPTTMLIQSCAAGLSAYPLIAPSLIKDSMADAALSARVQWRLFLLRTKRLPCDECGPSASNNSELC